MLRRRGHRFHLRPLGICEVRVVTSDFHRLTELPLCWVTPPTVRCQAPTTRFHAAATSPRQPRPTSQTGSEGISGQATISDKDQSVEVALISTLT